MVYYEQLSQFEPKDLDEHLLEYLTAVFRINHLVFSSSVVGQHRFVEYLREWPFLRGLILAGDPITLDMHIEKRFRFSDEKLRQSCSFSSRIG